ncbi:hypothetical protein C8J56DRAFT_785995, partial [Mycena floridula]
VVVRDVRTRWNFTYAMIRRAELLREAIQRWIIGIPSMYCLLPSAEDWKSLNQVAQLLEASCSFS